VQTLSSHSTPITALDFSEPYGTLVSAAQEDPQPRVWDLLSGQEMGRLRGHAGTVKCLQVEDHVCLTGSDDSTVRLWDLRRVEDDDDDVGLIAYSDTMGSDGGDGEINERPNGIRNGSVGGSELGRETAFVRALEGHSKAVTSMYFEDDCLVSGGVFILLTPKLTMCVGHRRLRQDNASVGSHNRTVCHDHGHPLGDIAPSNISLACTLWFVLPWNRGIHWKLCCSYSAVRRWYLGNVPGFCRCCTVLGVRTC